MQADSNYLLVTFNVGFLPLRLYTAMFFSFAKGKPAIMSMIPKKWFKSELEGVKSPEG